MDIGLRIPESGIATHHGRGPRHRRIDIGFPIIVRPSFTLGGTGGGVAYNPEDLEKLPNRAGCQPDHPGDAGRVGAGLEGIRTGGDAGPQRQRGHHLLHRKPGSHGVHTGDSITVAPAQTLTDREYQVMRDASMAIMREIGVDTGGSNVQFAINPQNGEMIVVEMNPGCPAARPWPPRPPVSPSPRLPPSWPWATRWMKSPTTSPGNPGLLRTDPGLLRGQDPPLDL
jgi:carbamoyl-phosphate synthase large subunit